MSYARVTSKRQVTFPKQVFDKLNIKAGDLLEIKYKDNVIQLRASNKTIFDLKGIVKIKGKQNFNLIRDKTLNIIAEEAADEGKHN